MNEAPSPENFHLPEETNTMVWRWVDKTWRLDMTNDGAIQVPNSKARTSADPSLTRDLYITTIPGKNQVKKIPFLNIQEEEDG